MSAREHAAGPIGERLAEGRERARAKVRPGGARGLFALQRAAGNSAVSALLAGKLRSSGDSVSDIDKALSEVRGSEPDIGIVEKGLKATKAAGVQVDLEGESNKPPASALAVVTTGFGPGAVAPKKPVPPTKPVKPVSPLGKAGAKAPKPAGPGKGGAKGGTPGKAPAIGGGGAAAAAPVAPAPLSKDKLLQPPVAPPGVKPSEDPAFAQVKGNVKGFASAKKAHPTADSKAKEAQGAALAPTDDVSGQAKAAKVDAMDAQQAGTFDKKAFIAAVKTAIEAKSPKTLKEADKYKESGKAGEVKGEVKGMVTQGKEGSAKDIEAATEAAPDQSKAVPKEVTPLQPEDPGKTAPIPAAGAVPKPAPAEQTNLEAGKHEANQEMADANVSEEQLAKSNEPEFQGALADKQKAAEHADKAPADFRQQEKATIADSKEAANAQTAAGATGMQGAKGAAVAKLVAAKGQTKSKDEAKRAEVTAKVQEIFTATEADVKKILDAIDPKVETAFEQGEAAARAKFEAFVSAKMSAYKRDRYGGWLGGLRWAKDKLLGMPDKVNEFYTAGRELYLKEMDGVISRVADIVGGDLNAAKQRIAKGRADIAAYVKTLSPDLQKVGDEAAKDIGDKFDQLESDVNDKQNAVVETLASKYVEARKGLDERIEELQAENKGLVDKAIGAIKAVINTIRNLAEMLKNVLARAASAIGDIIGDPIGFLGNLIGAVKGGINKFFSNIGAHLKKGLMGWLFGQLGDAGIEIPDTFDIKGIIKLLASIFGLTWANIRNRIVKQIGEKAMAAIEAGVDIFQKIASGGISAVWEMLMEKLGDIKKMIMDQIEDFVLTKIITAGITWLISLLNPAAAFIKACKLIYDVVMFFVNNAERIIKFVNTVIDGIVDIAKGNISAVVDRIEDALSQMVPILIGFIASVLGIGGIGEKVKSIVQALQKPVNKALDFVIKQGLKLAGPVIRGLQGIGKKAKAKVAAGKAWVKGKVDKAKGWAKDKASKVGQALGIVKKPFTVLGKGHTLSVDAKTGAIRMASREQPVTAAIRHEMNQINERRRAMGLDPITDPPALRNVLSQIAVSNERIENAKEGQSAVAQRQLDMLAPIITDLLSQIGGNLNEGQVGGAPGIGRIASHGENSGSVRRGSSPQHLWLESEHVIPVALVSDIFNALGDPRRIARPGPEDSAFHTIMVYERAADKKTRGSVGAGNIKVGLADTDAIGWSKAIGTKGAPNLRGRSRVALEHRKGTPQERAEREGLWRGLTPDQRVDLLRRMLPDRMAERVVDLNQSIRAEHDQNGQRRGETAPVPDPGAVRAAAAMQVQDIISIFVARLG